MKSCLVCYWQQLSIEIQVHRDIWYYATLLFQAIEEKEVMKFKDVLES